MPVDNISGNMQFAFQTGGAVSSAAEQGLFMGHAVQVEESPESILADAAEELTFACDTTDEFELSECRERDKAGSLSGERVRLYQELMHKAGKSADISRLRDSLKSTPPGRRTVDKAREFFPDPSDAWAALLELAGDAGAAGDTDTAERLRSAASTLEDEEGQAVRAGVQGAVAAAGWPELGDPEELRDAYRSAVGEFSTVAEVFSEIQSRFGADFDAAVDFLFAALSADIASDRPSMERAHLESVHGTLEQVRLTQSAFRLCETMMDRWENVHGMKTGNGLLDAMGLLSAVISLKDQRFIGAGQITPLAARSGAADIEHEVLFLQEFLQTVRKFPTLLFENDEGRMKLLSAVQDAVDDAVQREDEYLASLEE